MKITPSGGQTILPVGGLDGIQQIAADQSGNLFIANWGQDQGDPAIVEYFNGSGQSTITSGSPSGSLGVTVDSMGDFLYTQFQSSAVTEGLVSPQCTSARDPCTYVRVDNGSLSQPTLVAMGPPRSDGSTGRLHYR